MVPELKIPMLFPDAKIKPVSGDDPRFVSVVIVPVLEIPKSLSADIVPEFVIIPIVPSFLNP